jgi:hypothetical protein
MRDEHLRECGFILENLQDLGLRHSHRHAFRHGDRRCETLWLSDQTSFTQEFVGAQKRHHGFLALLRQDGDFDLAPLDIDNGIGIVALRKNDFLFGVRGDNASRGRCRQEFRRIEGAVRPCRTT